MWELPDEVAVIDDAIIERLRALVADVSEEGEDLARDLLDTYRDDLGRRLERYDEALAAGDPDEAAEAIHALKGASATVGALRVAHLCGVVEQSLREQAPIEGARQRIADEASAALFALERALLSYPAND